MPTRRVTLALARKGYTSAMNAPSLMSARPRRGVRLSAVAQCIREVARRRRDVGRAVTVGFDSAVRVDPAAISDVEWLRWGKQNLTPAEFERRERAVEADRASQPVLC